MRYILLCPLAVSLTAAELPMKQVVLYKNGLGFFVRSGDIKTGEPARLDFKASQMNDVLKSLTINMRSGGVAQLRYDSNEPLPRKLADFPFTVKPNLTLAALLDELKGARVEIRFGPESLAGTLVSARTTPPEKDRPERDTAVLLLDSGELRTVDLNAAQSIRFSDPRIQAQLASYLAAVGQARSKELRSVYIDAAGSSANYVAASYMAPAAVWKSSYRLIFGDKPEPSLEGWAIVDNTSGEDWTGVSLALVSGRPVSFLSQLYDPKYVERRAVELSENEPVAPVVHGGALASPAVPALPAPRFARSAGASIRSDVLTVSDVSSVPETREAGELFEYRFPNSVTIRRGESAMLPFVQQTVSARKLLIYTGEGTNPLNASELANTTGKTLDGGPITVFDSDSYAGEALMETLRPGEKRLISYAVDLGTRITTAFDSSSEVLREIHLRRGVLSTRSSVQEVRTYTIRNVDQKPKMLIIEHAVRQGFKLTTQKPTETNARAYRFEVKLDPAATTRFPVTEERLLENSVAVSSATPDTLLEYVRNRQMGDNTRKQLERIAAKKSEIADTGAAIARQVEESTEMTRDQERLRQNMESLNRVSGQGERVQQYARDLAAAETRLAALRDTRRALQQTKVQLERELTALIESAEF